MKLQAMLGKGDETRLVSADGADYEAAKLALQPLVDEDEQLLSYRRIED